MKRIPLSELRAEKFGNDQWACDRMSACMWQWLARGYIGLPFDRSHDFASVARGAQRHVGDCLVPEFPLAPTDYVMTAGAWWNMLPPSVQAHYEEPPAEVRDEMVVCGQGALGSTPDAYIHVGATNYRLVGGSSFRKIMTLYAAKGFLGITPADTATGRTIDDERDQYVFDFNPFEKWLIGTELRAYMGVPLDDKGLNWSGADFIADRIIRALWAGFHGRPEHPFRNDIWWIATHIPTPSLAWDLRHAIRSTHGEGGGAWGNPRYREPVLKRGREVILEVGRDQGRDAAADRRLALQGGWPDYADPAALEGGFSFALSVGGTVASRLFNYNFVEQRVELAPTSLEAGEGQDSDKFLLEIFAWGELQRYGFPVKEPT